jgi:hypothetical protein
VHNQHRPYRYLSDMPERMSVALLRCHTTIVHVGDHTNKGITTTTIQALIRRDLLTEGRDRRARKTWKPSHAGLTLIGTEEPRLLAAHTHKGYTTVPALAMFDEPEAVDDQTQRYQTADAHDRLQGQAGRRHDTLQKEAWNLSRRLKQSTRSLTDTNIEAAAQLERIRVEIDRLEQLRAA